MFSRKLLRCGDLSEKDFWLLLIEQVEKDGVMKLYKWSDGGNASPKRTRTGAGADEGAPPKQRTSEKPQTNPRQPPPPTQSLDECRVGLHRVGLLRFSDGPFYGHFCA